jgi:N-acetylneuraminic acid mutarotase
VTAIKHLLITFGLMALAACGGGGGGGSASTPPPVTYSANSGVAQKGPLIKGSTVTAQELNAMLSPTGAQYSYQITSDLGTFSPTSTFRSQYIGILATGYYFDELANAVSSGTVTLNGYSDLAVDSVLNVNLLTTLEYQRIQNLITKSNMTFAAARTQAESEVLAALNIPTGGYGAFGTLDESGGTDGDHILAAISSIFVYGNSAGPLSQLIANFQSDIGTNGTITNAKTTAALVAAAKAINPVTVASNLTQYYATPGLTFTAANISEWIAQSGDGVIGKFTFQVPDAAPSSIFTFPASVVNQFVGTPVSVTVGQFSVNGTPTSGTVSFNVGDVVTLSPKVGDFPNGVLKSYLVSGAKNLARVSFVSGLISIAVTPNSPSVPAGLTQQFTATGTFSDTSTANVTSTVTWTSGNSAKATINTTSGLANALAAGSTIITATSGSVSGSTTLTVTSAILESIAITPNPITTGVGINQQLTATGTYSDGSQRNVTTVANWTSDTLSVATVGPTTGLVMGVSAGSAAISATIGSVTGTAPVSIITHAWGLTGSMTRARLYHTATRLPNGTVLVAGGENSGFESYASAEIYNPAAGTWSVTGSMTTARFSHTATLLPNGSVLVAGGASGGTISTETLSSAEIYDPATGTWTTTGSMTSARIYHTATLLPNGTVLVAGGSGSSASAEIYNPASGTWTTTGSMTTAISGHTATLLSNGTVLVAGGLLCCGDNVSAGAEIYDPAAGSWTFTGSLSTGRASPTATLLPNGTVLVAGGYIGGAGFFAFTAGAEIYDPVAGTWTLTGRMSQARGDYTATLLPNGTVLAAGGEPGDNFTLSVTDTAEIYNPAADTWSVTGRMAAAREGHTATLLPNGTTLVAGGTTLVSTEIYYP